MLHTNASAIGRHVDPAAARADLRGRRRVLGQDREQAVVGVLADAPARRRRRARAGSGRSGTGSIGSAVRCAGEPVGRRARARAPTPRMQRVAELASSRPCTRAPPSRSTAGSAREQVRPVQRHAGAHARVIGSELGAEVDALLPVGHARRQLAADREPAAPRAPAVRHRDLGLLARRSAKNSRASRSSSASSVAGTPWTRDQAEAAALEGGIQGTPSPPPAVDGCLTIHERADVHRRDRGHS